MACSMGYRICKTLDKTHLVRTGIYGIMVLMDWLLKHYAVTFSFFGVLLEIEDVRWKTLDVRKQKR